MTWSDIFPILTDELLDDYIANAPKKFKREAASWFGEQRAVNQRDVNHIVSVSLFWKNIWSKEPDIVIKDRAFFMSAEKRKLRRFEPWRHYVQPLLEGAYKLHAERKDVAFRVYLAADLEFLIPDLVEAGCEVRLMNSSSIRHNPGAMWRFLALVETDKLVTVLDSDKAATPELHIQRTEKIAQVGLGWWRVPVWGELNEVGNVAYRPFLAMMFGMAGGLPEVASLMAALVWASKEKRIETYAKLPGCAPVQVHGTHWPDYGFDEWFLLSAVYPRAAFDGILSFIPADANSRLMPLDIQYLQWANPRSEIISFGSTAAGCCGGGGQPTAVTSNAELDSSYWRNANGLGYLANNIGMTRSGMEICLGDSGIASDIVRTWQGGEWQVFKDLSEQKQSKPANPGRTRGGKVVAKPLDTWRKVPASSQDIVWIPTGGKFEEMLHCFRDAWKKVRPGGIFGGSECRDTFLGAPGGQHRWICTKQALQSWARDTDVTPIVNNNGDWIVFKTRKPKPSEILVISAATADVPYTKITSKNHKDYCNFHGYGYKLYGEEIFERDKKKALVRPGATYKLKAMLDALSTTNYKWIHWIDVDAIYNDFDQELANFCIAHFDFVCPTWEDRAPRPSTGTILLQNTPTTKALLELIWSRPMSTSGKHEEDVFKDVLNEDPGLAKRLFGVPTRYLNSTPPHGNAWEPEDFILHFLSVKGDRTEILRDAIAMAKMRNGLKS